METNQTIMKKYKVSCSIGTITWDTTIEADRFAYSKSGVYEFENTQTKEAWFFPIYRTIIKQIN